MLDFHHKEALGEDEKKQKKRKEIIQEIKKKMNRKHVFYCLTRHAGKGERENMKRVHVVDDNKKSQKHM